MRRIEPHEVDGLKKLTIQIRSVDVARENRVALEARVGSKVPPE